MQRQGPFEPLTFFGDKRIIRLTHAGQDVDSLTTAGVETEARQVQVGHKVVTRNCLRNTTCPLSRDFETHGMLCWKSKEIRKNGSVRGGHEVTNHAVAGERVQLTV